MFCNKRALAEFKRKKEKNTLCVCVMNERKEA